MLCQLGHLIAASDFLHKMCAWRKLARSMKNMQFLMFYFIESQTVVITGDYGIPQGRAPIVLFVE